MKFSALKMRLIAPLVVVCCVVFFGSQSAHAACTLVTGGSGVGASDTNTVLMLKPTLTDSVGNPAGNLCTSLEAVQAQAAPLSLNVEIDDAAAWGAKSTAQFATYKAIVLGDADCPNETAAASLDAPVAAAVANSSTWGPAITGPVAVVNTDPEFHVINGNTTTTKTVAGQLTQNAIAYAVSGGTGKTGAYICLSCYYETRTSATTVNVLQPFGSFTVLGNNSGISPANCFAPSYIVDPANPVVTTPNALPNNPVANTGLSGWNCSAHEGFTNSTLPTNFSAAVRTGNSTTGLNLPYIITTQPSQTKTLGGPGTTTTFTFDTDTYKPTGVDNTGGEQVTVKEFALPQSSFPAGFLPSFPGERCLPYGDYSAAAGVDTCVEFQATCVTASGAPCNFIYQLATGYDLPSDLSGGIGGPDFLVAHGQPCPLTASSIVQSIFLSYQATIRDPTTIGGSRGPSCFVATYTPGATPVTTSVSVNSYPAGFFDPIGNPPIVNDAQAGSAIPVIWESLDKFNNPITPTNLGLTFCDPTVTTCGANTVTIQFFPIACGSLASASTDTVASAAGQSGLQFNAPPATPPNTWQLNAKSPKSFKDTCQQLVVAFPTGNPNQPGPSLTALFHFH